MPRLNQESLPEYHARLFRERPLSLEALEEANGLCDYDGCRNIECVIVKGLLSYIAHLAP